MLTRGFRQRIRGSVAGVGDDKFCGIDGFALRSRLGEGSSDNARRQTLAQTSD